MDYLCELPKDTARRKALNALPPTLHATYERILQRVNNSNKEIQQLVQRSLRWLVCTKEQLSSSALCEAITIETGDTYLDRNAIPDQDEILRWCSSLVRRSSAGDSLELAHFTVKEFLMAGSDRRHREFDVFHFTPKIDNAELAEKFLTYLLFPKHTSKDIIYDQVTSQNFPSGSGESSSLRQYAVLNWQEHARKNLSKPKVLSLTQELLHPSRQRHFTSWAEELTWIKCGSDDIGTENSNPSAASPLHFASMLA